MDQSQRTLGKITGKPIVYTGNIIGKQRIFAVLDKNGDFPQLCEIIRGDCYWTFIAMEMACVVMTCPLKMGFYIFLQGANNQRVVYN